MNLCADLSERQENLSERQEICASLINDSFFVVNQDVRFVMLVSAIEAPCDQHEVDVSYRSLIDHVLNYLSGLGGSKQETRRSLSSVLTKNGSPLVTHIGPRLQPFSVRTSRRNLANCMTCDAYISVTGREGERSASALRSVEDCYRTVGS